MKCLTTTLTCLTAMVLVTVLGAAPVAADDQPEFSPDPNKIYAPRYVGERTFSFLNETHYDCPRPSNAMYWYCSIENESLPPAKDPETFSGRLYVFTCSGSEGAQRLDRGVKPVDFNYIPVNLNDDFACEWHGDRDHLRTSLLCGHRNTEATWTYHVAVECAF